MHGSWACPAAQGKAAHSHGIRVPLFVACTRLHPLLSTRCQHSAPAHINISDPPSPMTQQDGDRSVVLDWEKRYVTNQGALPNSELSQVVEAVSQFQVACPACAS